MALMGKLLRVTGSQDLPTTFPRYHDAGQMVTPGHLAFIDFHHSLMGLQGVPVQGATIRNLARKEAARLCGRNREQLADLDWTLVLGAANAANQLRLERTSKGGLHMMVSQTAGTVDTHASIQAPVAIRQYVFENPTHNYIAILGRRITRNQLNATTVQQDLQHFSINEQTNNRELMAASQYRLWQNGMSGARTPSAPNAVLDTEDYEILSSNAWVNSDAPGSADDTFIGFGTGLIRTSQRASGYFNAAPSIVWRFVHLIDQTVNAAAGLTQTDVLAAIESDYSRGFAVGGRYYGDAIPSNPAVAVP